MFVKIISMKKDQRVINDQIVEVKTKKLNKKKSGAGGAKKIKKKIIKDKLENLLVNLNPDLKLKSIVKRVKKASKALIGDIKKNEKKVEKKISKKNVTPPGSADVPKAAGN